MKTIIPLHPALAAAAGLALLAAPAPAQDDDRDRNRDRPQNQNRRADGERMPDRADGRMPGRRGQTRDRDARNRTSRNRDARGGAAVLRPTGFVRIAVDYNNDGIVDAVETVYALDYAAARDSSRQRQESTNRRPRRVSGEVSDLKKITLSGPEHDHQHLVGKVKTDRDTVAKVDFGPVPQVKSLGLSEGDRVDVEGRRGRINDKAMLLATSVTSGDETLQIKRPKPSGARRVRGEITGLAKSTFRGADGESVVARVELVSGRTATVNLGSQETLRDLKLTVGDEVAMEVRPGSINDRPALIATRVNVDGKTVDVSPTGGSTKGEIDMSRDGEDENS